jgi:hypothetical protein
LNFALLRITFNKSDRIVSFTLSRLRRVISNILTSDLSKISKTNGGELGFLTGTVPSIVHESVLAKIRSISAQKFRLKHSVFRFRQRLKAYMELHVSIIINTGNKHIGRTCNRGAPSPCLESEKSFFFKF